ncbi:MAG: cbb3-type cytochrome c oxidase subunit 3 [Tistrella sp.]|jgi:cbb3-type cytochrome oxidase subunit 3|uniref:cbb3-type cytochrome c oxidase subunit 3 n=1 Tax=Tistrella TaxID=171436 RepID=UPI000314B130|nr:MULTISPECIES: cbb3-type cytochrome c oxidase subunit 3 [Tistrella]MAD35895.1 cbb3-type cytochrome c oxidase subunit 3 [Tistrella sp.]MBA74531.1 cbb3-type cytochrome c oxidase subunit 3 [Tistrella sp.]|tara:strand:+ start:152 stop:319 length:168 start_codon:yes stop_codon:yes gene_type:complete
MPGYEELVAVYQFVRSWWIVAVMILLVVIGVRAFLPGQKAAMDSASRIPLRDDDA